MPLSVIRVRSAITAALLGFVAAGLLCPAAADARFGDLDAGFGFGGQMRLHASTTNESGAAVALQPDGKIISVGYANRSATGDDLMVARLLPNGMPDSSFGAGAGYITTAVSPGAGMDRAVAALVQPDGKIVAAGSAVMGGATGQDAAVARYLPNGALDPSFGVGGIITPNRGGPAEYVTDAKLDASGRIVLGVRVTTLSGQDYDLVRLNANGSMDASFGAGGRTITAISPDGAADYTVDMTVAADGGVLVAGHADSDPNDYLSVLRYGPNGLLDAGFATAGAARTAIGPAETVRAVLVQADGRIAVAGHSPSAGFGLARLLASGQPDPSFGAGGHVLGGVGPGNGEPTYYSLHQAEGKLVIGGHSKLGEANYDLSLVRYNATGALDNGFGGGDGRVVASSGAESGGAINNNLTFQGDGKLLITGFARASLTDTDTLVSRYRDYRLSDPSITDPQCDNPTIGSVTPGGGVPGDRMTVSGSGFGVRGTLLVGGRPATVETWAPTRIVAYVPYSAGGFSVAVRCGSENIISNPRPFVSHPAGNLAPVANITYRYRKGAFRVSSALSADPDGRITRRRWRVGNRTVGKRVTFKRKVKAGRKLKLRLAVTDNKGATGSRTVTARAPRTKRELQTIRVLAPSDVGFAFGSCKLSGSGKRYLRKLRPLVSGARSLTLSGHTDWVGTAALNQSLGKCRASAVRRELLRGLRAKSKPRKSSARSYGERKPLASNAQASGRAKNRRVEILIRTRS